MYDKNNVFAKIIRGEIPSNKVYEDDQVLAFKDVSPAAPVHILVLPKAEYISFHDFMEKANKEEIAHFYKIVQKICADLNLEKNGYRVMCNVGSHGMQTVPHMHLHILAGKPLGRLVS
ncbi:MAG: histidine triad nucleotide-binding protein [Pseudomonadota bacterium]